MAVPSAASSPYLGPTGSDGWTPSSPAPLTKVNRGAAGAAAAGRRKVALSELPAVPDDLPALSIGILDARGDKVDALDLVADSIAQQRNTASRYLAAHPCLIAGLTACLVVTQQFLRHCDTAIGLMLHSSIVTAYFLGIRLLTSHYARLSAGLGWSWLSIYATTAASSSSDDEDDVPPGEEDTVIGVHFKSELIGALVLRMEVPAFASAFPSPSGSFSSHSRSTSSSSISSSFNSNTSSSTTAALSSNSTVFTKRHRARNSSTQLRRVGGHGSGFYTGKGVIRAWTIKDKYRNQGVGSDLLHEAVRVTRERCGKDAAVGFASQHANSATMDLPELFCGHVRRAEQKAARALEDVLKGWEESKRRRKL